MTALDAFDAALSIVSRPTPAQDWLASVEVPAADEEDGRPAMPIQDSCSWAEDEDENWNTGCGHCFVLTEGYPRENEMRFCCYCGKPLAEWRIVVPCPDCGAPCPCPCMDALPGADKVEEKRV